MTEFEDEDFDPRGWRHEALTPDDERGWIEMIGPTEVGRVREDGSLDSVIVDGRSVKRAFEESDAWSKARRANPHPRVHPRDWWAVLSIFAFLAIVTLSACVIAGWWPEP